jgi:hypothetical protein
MKSNILDCMTVTKCCLLFSNATTCLSWTWWSPSWLWQKCNWLLRCGRPWGAITLSRWGGWWYMNMEYQEWQNVIFYINKYWYCFLAASILHSVLQEICNSNDKACWNDLNRWPLWDADSFWCSSHNLTCTVPWDSYLTSRGLISLLGSEAVSLSM